MSERRFMYAVNILSEKTIIQKQSPSLCVPSMIYFTFSDIMTGDSGGNKLPAGKNKKMASFQRDSSFIFNFCKGNL